MERSREAVDDEIRAGRRQGLELEPRDLKYWQYLSDVLAPEPPEARDGFFYAMMLPLGIQKGKPFDPTERQKKILTDAARCSAICWDA